MQCDQVFLFSYGGTPHKNVNFSKEGFIFSWIRELRYSTAWKIDGDYCRLLWWSRREVRRCSWSQDVRMICNIRDREQIKGWVNSWLCIRITNKVSIPRKELNSMKNYCQEYFYCWETFNKFLKPDNYCAQKWI